MGSPVGKRLIPVRAVPGSPAPRIHSLRFWHLASEHKVRKSQCIGIPKHRCTRWAEQGDHCPYSQSSIATCLLVQSALRPPQVTAQGAEVFHNTLGPAEKPPAPHTALRSHYLLADLQTGPKDRRAAATCCCQTRTCLFLLPISLQWCSEYPSKTPANNTLWHILVLRFSASIQGWTTTLGKSPASGGRSTQGYGHAAHCGEAHRSDSFSSPGSGVHTGSTRDHELQS